MKKETIGGQTIEFEVRHISAPTKQRSDNFHETSDRWLFVVKGETFDYYTGTGHREYKRSFDHLYDRRTWESLKYKNLTENGFKKFIECSTPTPPDLKGLLHSILMESSANDMSFDDWCGEFDYDTDSIKAQRTYFDCQENSSKLRKLGFDMDKLREELEGY